MQTKRPALSPGNRVRQHALPSAPMCRPWLRICNVAAMYQPANGVISVAFGNTIRGAIFMESSGTIFVSSSGGLW